MRTILVPCLMLAGGLLLSGGAPAAGQEGAPAAGYRIKPSDVVVPEGVPPGRYRRIITPFENWTLICDENLKTKKKVCNVSQIIENASGAMVFSWSLAATADGQPFMILRAAREAGANARISLAFPGRQRPVEVKVDGCNQSVCVGMVPVGPTLKEEIGKGAQPVISYGTTSGGTVSVTASLKGLATALSAIK